MDNGKTSSDRLVKYLEGELSVDALEHLDDRVDTAGSVKIGSGSLGDVILVREKATGHQLAAKVISLQRLLQSGANEARIRREVQAMRELDHPNIVRLVGVLVCRHHLAHVGSEPPYICILMEYVRNSEPLSNVLRRSGPQPQLSLRVVAQLVSALAQMHSRGLVHRDVWSENVLVDSKRGSVVLVDLGNAEFFDRGPVVHSAHMNLPYLSPQCTQGERQQPGDDCWALGLLITELVTGRFVLDRAGRTDVPLHFKRAMLKEAISETVAKGGPVLGKLCPMFLEVDASRRLSMADALAEISRNDGQTTPMTPSPPLEESSLVGKAPASPNLSQSAAQGRRQFNVSPPGSTKASNVAPPGGAIIKSNNKAASCGLAPGMISNSPSYVAGAVGQVVTPPGGPTLAAPGCDGGPTGGPNGPSSDSPADGISPGAGVYYLPRSNNSPQPAVVVGRMANSKGWQIRLAGGLVKEVDENDAWRLLPATVPTSQILTSPPLSGAVACAHTSSATTAAPGQPTRRSLTGKSPALSFLAPLPTTVTTAFAQPLFFALATDAPGAQAQKTPRSRSQALKPQGKRGQQLSPSPSGFAPAINTVYGSVSGPGRPNLAFGASTSVAPMGGSATVSSTSSSLFREGQAVAYLAKTDKRRYRGKIVSRTSDQKGWRVDLDCGVTKEVTDADIWRLVPVMS